jgi:hypothetical protein
VSFSCVRPMVTEISVGQAQRLKAFFLPTEF